MADFYHCEMARVLPYIFESATSTFERFEEDHRVKAVAGRREAYSAEVPKQFAKGTAAGSPGFWSPMYHEHLLKVEKNCHELWGADAYGEMGTFFVRDRIFSKFGNRAKDDKFRKKLTEADREGTRYRLLPESEIVVAGTISRRKILSFVDAGQCTDPRQIFARLAGRVVGFQASANPVVNADAREDIIFDVPGETAGSLNQYMIARH